MACGESGKHWHLRGVEIVDTFSESGFTGVMENRILVVMDCWGNRIWSFEILLNYDFEKIKFITEDREIE